jgi:hypothetical protein
MRKNGGCIRVRHENPGIPILQQKRCGANTGVCRAETHLDAFLNALKHGTKAGDWDERGRVVRARRRAAGLGETGMNKRRNRAVLTGFRFYKLLFLKDRLDLKS